MTRNIPGLNNQLYAPMVTARGSAAESEYMNYKSVVSPLQKKLMYPTMLGAMFADPMYARPLLEKFGPKGLASKVEATGALGAISGLSVLLPRALSEGYKSRRLAHERSYAKQLGAVGSASRLLDSLSSLRNLMTLPGYTAQMLGYGSGLLKHTPRLEHFLTGQVKNVFGKGAAGENTGGLLSSAYGGAKNLGDFLTGGHVSGAIAAGAKKGGIAGSLSSGVGLLDKGISGLLSSPSGVMFGLMGAQIGLGIYKSIKLAKLQPNQQPPDKFARRFYSPSPSQTALNRILTLAGSGKVDPQTLSFMVQQVQLSELQRLNMQMAGLRGEYHSENDFIRQEKEKGTDRMSDEYGREILGEDDRSGVSKVLDKLEHGLHTFKAKYDPIAQLVNFGVGLLQGKIITPKSETSRIADAYGYSDEKEMLKERAEQFGITADQTRLLHTTSKAILQMAPTYEGKMLAILSASFDVQRAIASEAVTIRTGMGFDKNIMYTKEKGFLSRMMSGIAGAITNIPGLNALGNLVRGTGKFIKGAAAIPHKVFEKGKEALGKTRDYFFGEAYTKIKDKDEWAKAAGLYISGQDKAFDYVGNGLPNQLERIRSVLFDIYYVQDAMLQEMGGEVTKADERLIWSPTEKRYVTLKAAKELEESQKIQLEATRERAFREGPLGKMLFVADLLSTQAGKGFFNNLSQKITVGRSLERMHGAERLTREAEIALSGEPFTFETSRAMTEILADISSIKSTMATAVHSMAEIESERQLERTPESIGWQIRSALTVAGVVAGTLLGGPAGWVGAGAAGIAFLKARQEREKEIAEERERAIDTRNIVERGVEIQEEYFSKSFEERFGLDLLDKSNQNILQGLKKVTKHEQMIDQLKIIASYLGDKTGSVYELLEPGQRIAEVTIVDRDGKSIFVDNIMPPQITQQLLILKDIRDYLGGKPSSISNLLDPNQPDTAQVQVLNAAAKGGPVDKDKPMLVGEKGPEILMPRSAGMIIPNDQIDKFADGGTFKGEIFSKIYQKISDLVSINFDSLKLEIDQGKKEEKDAQQLTMMEKLQALRERLKEKEEKTWKDNVVLLLTGILKKPTEDASKEKKKEKSIWDWLLNPDFWKKLGIVTAIIGLGTAIWSLITKYDEIKKWVNDHIGDPLRRISDWLESHGMSFIEQLKLLGRGLIGAGVMVDSAEAGGLAKSKGFLRWLKGEKAPSVIETGKTFKQIQAENEALKIRQGPAVDKTYKPKSLKDIMTEVKRAKEIESRFELPKTPRELGEIIKQRRELRLAEEASKRPWGRIKGLARGFGQETKIIGTSITESGPVQTAKAIGEATSKIVKSTIQSIKGTAGTVGEKFTGVRAALADPKLGRAGTWITEKSGKVIEAGLKGFESIAKVFGNIQKTGIIDKFGKAIEWFGKGFSKILTPLKTFGKLLGRIAVPLQIIMTIFDFASDALEGYKEGGLMGGIKGFFLGPMKDDMETTLGQVGKYFGLGMLIGVAGGPLGMLVGGFAGATVGALISALKSAFMAYDEDGMGGFLKQLFTGDQEGGLLSAIKTAGPYAAIGAIAGIPFGGPIGMLIGGLVGAGIGGLIGWIGQWGLSDFVTNIGDSFANFITRSNNTIIDLFSGPGQKYGEMGAIEGSKLAFGIGPLIGGILGSVVDLFVNIGQFAGRVIQNLWIWAKNQGRKIPVIGKLIGGEEESYVTGDEDFAKDAQRAKDSKLARDQALENQNKGQEARKAMTAKEREVVLAKKKTAEAAVPSTPAGTPGGTPPPTVAASTSATPSGTETPKTSPTPTDTTTANVPSAPGSIASVLQEASAATGAPLGIMQKMAYAESGFDPNAKAKGSSASGLFQFIKDTWDTMLGRKGKKYGLSPDTSPFDARANALMGGESIQENIKSIQSSVLAPPPNAADVYAAHFMGADGAKQLFREIKKNPNTIAADVFPKAAKANRPIFYDEKGTPRTVRQIYEVLAQKMSTDPSAALAKAGTGLTAGEKVSEFGYKAGEKAKDIFGILGEFASKIKDAFMDALTRQFTGERIQKKPTDKKSEMKSLEAERDKYAKETSEQAQLDLAASKVSSTPHKMIENYVAERHLIILANKDFQNYYNTHLIASKKKGGKGSKLSTEDIKTAALMIAQKEFLNNPNAESIGMVANLPYKFNPDTAPFKEYLVDSKSSGTKKSEDEVAKGLRERAEKTAESEDKKDSNTTGASSKTADAAMAKSAPKIDKPIESGIGGIGKISNEELAKFQAMSDNDKFKYLEKNYPKGTPIPLNLRKEAKRLRYIDVVEPEKFGQEKNGAASENIVDAAGAKSTPIGMVANLPYKFNPDTAPFKEYLVDSKSSGTKKSEDEVAKGLRERAEKTAESQRLDNNVQQGFARLRAKREAELSGKSGENKNVAIAAGPGTNAAAAVGDELYKRSEVNNPWAKYWNGHYSASDQAVTEDIRSFQEQSPGGQRSFLKDFFDRGETPYPYLLDAAQKAGIVDKSGNLITEAAGSQYGAVKNPAQTTAGIKATADTMKTSPAETAKSDEASKQEVAKKLAQLQSTIKPASQKGALVGAGGSQSVPRASGNLGTSISGPIDDLLENLFNHTLLNDLNKIYPTSYAV